MPQVARATETLVAGDALGMVSAGLAQMWVMFAVTKGLDADELCAAAGFRSADIADRDRQIPRKWYVALRRCVIDGLPDVEVGIELATFGNLASFGYLGLAMERCSNSLELLRLVLRYSRTLSSEAPEYGPRLEVEADTVHWIIPRVTEDPPEAAEAILLGCLLMLRQFSGASFCPRRVSFVAEPGVRGERLKQVFECPLEFGAPDARIVFRLSDLERPFRGADPAAATACEAELQRILTRLDEPFVAIVSRTSEALLGSGDVTAQQTARRLGLSTRSLQRKLRSHGVTHQRLVEDARRNGALRALADPGRSVDEIALSLGYEDVSGLNRAFRRWTGSSPSAYRRNSGSARGSAR